MAEKVKLRKFIYFQRLKGSGLFYVWRSSCQSWKVPLFCQTMTYCRVFIFCHIEGCTPQQSPFLLLCFLSYIFTSFFFFFIHLARPGDEVKVAQGVKDFRSHSLPIMKPPDGQSPYILTPTKEKVAHESLGRRESIDLLVSRCSPRLKLPSLFSALSPNSDSPKELFPWFSITSFFSSYKTPNLFSFSFWSRHDLIVSQLCRWI